MTSASSDTIDVCIWFTCKVQRRHEGVGRRALVLQTDGKPTQVTVAAVPKAYVTNGVPSAPILWQAETMFLERQHEYFPDHEVVSWEAREGSATGQLLSRFSVLLPANVN